MYTSVLFCQEIELTGRVIADSISVNIYNISKNKGVINDNEGYFKILATINDTISFSSIQHKNFSLKITKDHIENPYMEIIMESKVETLNEVFISSSGLSGNLKNDLMKIPLKEYIDGRIYGGKRIIPLTSTQRAFKKVNSGAINKIVNTINGKIKKAKQNILLENKTILVTKVRSRFSEDFFVEELGVSMDYIQDFMNYCAADIRFIAFTKIESSLELISFFKEKSIAYKKMKAHE